MDRTVDVIIPVYRPDKKLERLLQGLDRQTHPVHKVWIVETIKDTINRVKLPKKEGLEYLTVPYEEFDHGGTRSMAAQHSQADFLLFMTQDAIPCDSLLIEKLLEPMADEKVGVSYARQLPSPSCHKVEAFIRQFNYPPKSRVKWKKDLGELGIKTFFCSDVCAMYRHNLFDSLDGFASPIIFNEDMVMAGRMIAAGYGVAYAAKARVIHSHNYSGREQLHRNFDLGVSQACYKELFAQVPSEKEGLSLVKKTTLYLVKEGAFHLIIPFYYQCGMRFLGYRLGKHYAKLPRWMVRRLTMNPTYWQHKEKYCDLDGNIVL